ncbi:hypothetical protein SDC9_211077 [bioreactor metagenome]|uniref:LamG-like jellyroll fold domain-containing protein n=1 Tax=bioreactor metagenome TaxID=1076179 RepID=A0A645JKS3_9ZZZZ
MVAVRDAAAKQLRLYVDGKPVGETAEKGSGHLGGRNSIQSGYDNWGGAYFIGGMHYFSLLDRALNASEVAALDRTLRQ